LLFGIDDQQQIHAPKSTAGGTGGVKP
jgi:hypothetical protein